MRDLTERLGIGAASLYHAFGPKQQLFDEAVKVYDGRYGDFIEAALSEEPTAGDAVTRILAEAPERYTRRGLPAGCLVASGAVGSTDPAAIAATRRVRQHKVRLVAAKVRHDVAEGRLPDDTDPDAVARFTMAVLTGMAQDARDGVPRARLRAVASVAAAAWPGHRGSR